MKDFNLFSIIGGAVGGILAFLFGGFDVLLCALIVLIILDYITGVIKAFKLKMVSSEIGFIGLLKKIVVVIVVVLSTVMQHVLKEAIPLREVVITFFICNEGISILENAAEFIPIPTRLKKVLLQLRDSTEKEEDNNDGDIC